MFMKLQSHGKGHFHHAKQHFSRPRLLLACLVIVFALSVTCQIYWFRNSALRTPGEPEPTRRRKVVDLSHEDPEACVELEQNHLEAPWALEGACWKRREVQQMLIDIVGNFSALMNAHNLSHWVDSGTLLGAIRHQGLIPHDQDSDFGIDEDAYKYLRDSPIEVPEPFVLHVWDSDVNDPGKRDEAIPIRFVNTNSGLYSDVFVFKDWEDRYERPMLGPVPSGCFGDCVRCDSVDGAAHFQVPYEWIYPLVTCKFEHFSTFCPRESIKYIRYLFGDDYMTPQ